MSSSKTVTVTTTPTLIARGDGSRDYPNVITIRATGATAILVGDETSQELTIAGSGASRVFTRILGQDIWARTASGSNSDVEVEQRIVSRTEAQHVLDKGTTPNGPERSVKWFSSRHPDNTDQLMYEKFLPGGSTIQAGSTASSDTNDPLFLEHNGWEHYIYSPGSTGNKFSIPDAANLDITGDLDLRCDVTLDTYSGAGTQSLISKRAAAQSSYQLRVNNSGNIEFAYSTDGSTVSVLTSTAALTTAAGARTWVRVTLDADNGASDADATFYTSTDGSTWTQVGDVVNAGSTLTLHAGTADLTFLERGTGNDFAAGKFYRGQVYDGIAGTLVADIWPAEDIDVSTDPDAGQTSFTASTGQTVTVARGTSTTALALAVVTRGVWLFDGTDDYMDLTDHLPVIDAHRGSYTFAVSTRRHSTSSTFGRLFSTESGNNNGLSLRWNSSNQMAANVGGATTNTGPSAQAYTASDIEVFVVTVDGPNQTLYIWQLSDTSQASAAYSHATIGEITLSSNIRIGARADTVTNTAHFELLDLVIMPNEVLIKDEAMALAEHLRTGAF